MSESFKKIEAGINSLGDLELTRLIKHKMSNLTKNQIQDIDFSFWFCCTVERSLDKILSTGLKNVKLVLGEMPKEFSDYVKEKYDIKMEYADPAHPNFNPNTITFGDRVYFIEKILGKSPYVKFLWKIKKIRDAASHGRWDDLIYQNEKLTDIKVKKKIILDYLSVSINIKTEENGILKSLSKTDKEDINAKFNEFIKKGE